MDPKPRVAKIRPPLQQRAANTALNIDKILNNFSFIIYHPKTIL